MDLSARESKPPTLRKIRKSAALSLKEGNQQRDRAVHQCERHLKGRPPMHTSPIHAITSPPTPSAAFPQSSPAAERAYQGLTIAAMLLILASILLV
jgi:hypothetical protein